MNQHSFSTILRALTMVAIALCVAIAHASPAVLANNQAAFPAGLKWQTMKEVSYQFHPKYTREKEDPRLTVLAHSLWKSEIDKSKASKSQAPMFFLVAQAQSRNYGLIFSLIDLDDYERCEPAANGKNVVDMYSKCLLRISVNSMGYVSTYEYKNFCYLNIDSSPDTPLAQNHTEFAIDDLKNRAYFRVIQYGKPVPTCNRAIQIQ